MDVVFKDEDIVELFRSIFDLSDKSLYETVKLEGANPEKVFSRHKDGRFSEIAITNGWPNDTKGNQIIKNQDVHVVMDKECHLAYEQVALKLIEAGHENFTEIMLPTEKWSIENWKVLNEQIEGKQDSELIDILHQAIKMIRESTGEDNAKRVHAQIGNTNVETPKPKPDSKKAKGNGTKWVLSNLSFFRFLQAYIDFYLFLASSTILFSVHDSSSHNALVFWYRVLFRRLLFTTIALLLSSYLLLSQ